MDELHSFAVVMSEISVRVAFFVGMGLCAFLFSKGDELAIAGYALLAMELGFLPVALVEMLNNDSVDNGSLEMFLVASVLLISISIFSIATPYLKWQWLRE